MKKFMLVFRVPSNHLPTEEDVKSRAKDWEEWIGGIAAQGKFVNAGARLANEGKVLKMSGVITDGPFVEIKEQLGGFIVIKAESLDEATTLSHGCPIFMVGGSVEIRQVVA